MEKTTFYAVKTKYKICIVFWGVLLLSVVVFCCFFGGVFLVFCSMTARACSFMVEHPLMMSLVVRSITQVVLSAFLVVLSAF